MHSFINNIRGKALAALALFAMTSCVYDNDMPDDPNMPVTPGPDRTLLSLGFSMPMSRAENGESNGYIAGVDYENYLDIRNGGYRIYFFDKDNKYITRFIPIGVTPSGDGENTYDVLGVAPDKIVGLNDYKIVVLANWPNGYPDDELNDGTITTIDELCSHAKAQYDCLPNFDLNPDEGRLIPFFGLHHYTQEIVKGERTTLEEPIALLRAMAKVEVVVDINGVSLTDLVLRGYNTRGYCAPVGINEHTDYDHAGADITDKWNQDYTKTPHLIGGKNEDNSADAFIPLLRRYEQNGTQKETWIAYVPEYLSDVSDGAKNAHLEFKLDIREDKTYSVYFAKYDAGKMVADTYQHVLRNNYYRFTISIDHGALVIKVKKWENAYDNKFTFE